MVNAQDWLNQQFPTPESKNQVLHIKVELLGNGDRNSSETRPLSTVNPEVCHWFNAYLEGELNLNGFTQLKSLSISGRDGFGQNLTLIDLSDCWQLEKLELISFATR